MENPRGIYRIPSLGRAPACVWVKSADGKTFKVSEERYRLNKYTPKIDDLQTEDEYRGDRDA